MAASAAHYKVAHGGVYIYYMYKVPQLCLLHIHYKVAHGGVCLHYKVHHSGVYYIHYKVVHGGFYIYYITCIKFLTVVSTAHTLYNSSEVSTTHTL